MEKREFVLITCQNPGCKAGYMNKPKEFKVRGGSDVKYCSDHCRIEGERLRFKEWQEAEQQPTVELPDELNETVNVKIVGLPETIGLFVICKSCFVKANPNKKISRGYPDKKLVGTIYGTCPHCKETVYRSAISSPNIYIYAPLRIPVTNTEYTDNQWIAVKNAWSIIREKYEPISESD